MATLHAIGGTIDIDMNSSNLVNHNAQSAPVGVDRYTWTTTSGNTIRAFSFEDDITFNATSPTGGTVHALQVDNSYTVGGMVGNLVSMSTGASNLANYWHPILSGVTTILTSANASFNGVGDFLNIVTGENRTGANDLFEGEVLSDALDFQTFFGDSQFVGGSATLSGGDDTINMRDDGAISGDASGVAGRLNGGDDKIAVIGPGLSDVSTIVGDAIFTTDLEAGFVPLVNGGNDVFDVDSYSSSDFGVGIIGDVQGHNVGTVNGGDDIIDCADNPFFLEAFGDVKIINSGTVNGGKDKITASKTIANELSGDTDLIDAGTLFGGADSLIGGNGGDSLFGEFISQNGGSVSVNATFTGADSIYGAGGGDVIRGQVGNDILDGGMGDDIIDGGLSSGSTGDMAAFNTLNIAVSADLGAGFAFGQGNDSIVDVESLRGSNQGDSLGGNANANRLEGLNGNDQIIARGGNDVVLGGNGNDVLKGVGGNDSLTGGAGADNLSGGGNNDLFIYTSIADSGTAAATRDIITAFSQGGVNGDRFHLTAIDANTGVAGDQNFNFIGAAAFSAAGQVRATASGGNTLIELNVTGASGAEAAMLVSGSFVLAVPDFVL